MLFLKKLAARFGKGAMTVRLQYEKTEYKRGEEVKGTIDIFGGDVEQKTLGILIYLMVEKKGIGVVSFGDYKVHSSFDIAPGEKLSIPFVIELPIDGPFTSETESVFLMTNVVKLLSVDQRDKKYITILS